jgi:hypothetical protein
LGTIEELFPLEDLILGLDAVGRHLYHFLALLFLVFLWGIGLAVPVHQSLYLADGACCLLDRLVQRLPACLYHRIDLNVVEGLLDLMVDVEGQSSGVDP